VKPIPLFGLGNRSKASGISAQERVNLYVHAEEDGESGSVVSLMGTPGLLRFVDSGANATRGVYEKNDVLYIVNATTLWEVLPNGTMTNRGTLEAVSGRVDMADNGEQLLIVDGTFGYIYTFATNTFAKIADPDFPAATTCAFLNGYFLVQKTDSAELYISALYDGTSWDALDFATAESDPDNLMRLYVLGGVVHLLGTKTTEFWGDSGAEDFPFARIGASAIQWGLAARWSLCEFQDSLIFLARNKLGAAQVVMLSGSTPVPVSQDIDQIISGYTTSNATGLAYTVEGHPFYQLNFPTDDVTWVYDGLTKVWHRAQYSTAGRHRGEIAVVFVNQPYVTDWQNGKLYRLDPETYTDDGATIVREFVSRHQKSGDWSHFASLWIEMQAGVGLQSGQGSDPQVMLQISRDNKPFGAELWRSFGRVGQYTARAVWNRLGRARNWTFRVRVTDPVPVTFIAAWGRHG
jgi:hypothetical protein